MADKEERVQSLEDQVEEIKKSLFKGLEILIPPKEVREEITRNVYQIQLSALKILKALVDYQVSLLEERTKVENDKKNKKGAKRIKVE